MADIHCFSYVEDAPSAAVIRKLVERRNACLERAIIFRDGFPAITGGYDAIKNNCKAFLNMARAGVHTLTLTDLDSAECACSLIRDWFDIPNFADVALPPQCIFRVAVREVESWIIADHAAWAKFIGISAANFTTQPDYLNDPKKHLLDVIRRKGRKRVHREMLPQGVAHIGPRYNEVLCDFVENIWEPERAAIRSPSLERTIRSLMNI